MHCRKDAVSPVTSSAAIVASPIITHARFGQQGQEAQNDPLMWPLELPWSVNPRDPGMKWKVPWVTARD